MYYPKREGVMLCYPFEEKRLDKWTPPYIVQIKYDGDRAINEPVQGMARIMSSYANEFLALPHINLQLDQSNLGGLPFDGEMYNHDIYLEGGGRDGGHQLIHSIVAPSRVEVHPRFAEMNYYVYDLKLFDQICIKRIMELEKISVDFPKNVKFAPYWICNSLDEIKKIYDELMEQHYEGIIIRNILGDYREKRSIFLMKFKPKKSDAYMIVGCKEQKTIHGELKGTLGSITFVSDRDEEFSVSAGLNDDQRRYLWTIREQLPGNIGIIHYQNLTQSKIPKGSFDIEIPDLGIT